MTRPCPRCGAALDGGPVLYTCQTGHGVFAADLNTEYHAPRGNA
ncbi:hypothetical protein AB0B89_29235 [Sphaerisporangium sp. NPDC049002]